MMSGKQAPTNKDEARHAAGIFHASGAVFLFILFCISLTIGYLSYLIFEDGQLAGLELAVLGSASGLLTYFIERSLAQTSINRSRHYRLSFLGGAGFTVVIGIVFWIVFFAGKGSSTAYFQSGQILSGIGLLLVVPLGAFAGGLVATGIHERLWENNSPPPEDIQREVYAIHQTIIGYPGKGPWTKRAFDVLLALFGLFISIPVWSLSMFLIWFEDPGPVLFVKNSVGKGGANFFQFKLRTMVREAEQETGPVLAVERDERILRGGGLLRKTALDELPQLINILRGEMSFVGPRPQRTVLVHDYLKSLPEYTERHRVRPGLAGLAQVAGDYYLTPRQKLRFDLIYIRHIGLGFDLKLLLCAFLIAFWYRWQKDWDGRVPRKLIHFGGRAASYQD